MTMIDAQSMPRCSPRGPRGAREQGPVLCPQARAVINGAAGRDGRVRAGVEAGAHESAASDLVRAAVMLAGDMGVSRRAVARGLGVSERTLDHWMSPGEGRGPSAGAVAALLFDAGVVPATVRERLVRWVAECAGMTAVKVDTTSAGADVGVQVLEVQAAGGVVCAAASKVTDGASERGRAVTRAEAVAMLPAAREQLREVGELVETLARIAASGC